MADMDEKKLLPKRYKRRFEVEKISPGDLGAVLDMGLASLKGRSPKYPETQEGLEEFKENTLNYFKYIQNCNKEDETEHNLIPDVEGLCCYLGISRKTLLVYENNRDEEWKDFIQKAKTLITATKKQLIFRQKIPPVVGIFDLCNNSDYVNSSEFKLNTETQNRITVKARTPEEIAAEYGEELSVDVKLPDMPE
jgi:hypothetical protein